jgi:hypothetical protein
MDLHDDYLKLTASFVILLMQGKNILLSASAAAGKS